MDRGDLPSDSDSSDDDFVPKGAQESGEDSVGSDEGEIEEEEEDEEEGVGSKRKKKPKRGGGKIKKKRRKNSSKEDADDAASSKKEEVKEVPEEEFKTKADSLWADFMKDVGGSVKTKKGEEEDKAVEKKDSKTDETKKPKVSEKVSESKVYTFAGEEVKINKEASAVAVEADAETTTKKGGALSSILGRLGSNKNKLTTLEKSKLDWQQFKDKEGIEDELQIHNRGRGGYLERQAFLERTDLRQFEIEKNMRSTHRGKR